MIKRDIKLIVLVGYLLGFSIFMEYFNEFLNKPDPSTWDQVKNFIRHQGYKQEPIVFNPDWLANYAKDYSRFKNFKIGTDINNVDVLWYINLNERPIPRNFKVILTKRINNIYIRKLVKNPG